MTKRQKTKIQCSGEEQQKENLEPGYRMLSLDLACAQRTLACAQRTLGRTKRNVFPDGGCIKCVFTVLVHGCSLIKGGWGERKNNLGTINFAWKKIMDKIKC